MTYVPCNTEARTRNNCSCEKAVGITYSEFVFVALVTQLAKHMYCIILSAVTFLAIPYFSTLSYKQHDYRGKKIIEHKIRVLFFSTAFVYNIFHSKQNSARNCLKFTYVFM